MPFAYIGMNDSRDVNGTLLANSSYPASAISLFSLDSTTSAVVTNLTRTDDWLGAWPNHAELPLYLDTLFMIVIGGYAVQVTNGVVMGYQWGIYVFVDVIMKVNIGLY